MNENLPKYARVTDIGLKAGVGHATVYRELLRHDIEPDAMLSAGKHGYQPIFLESRIQELADLIKENKDRYKRINGYARAAAVIAKRKLAEIKE